VASTASEVRETERERERILQLRKMPSYYNSTIQLENFLKKKKKTIHLEYTPICLTPSNSKQLYIGFLRFRGIKSLPQQLNTYFVEVVLSFPVQCVRGCKNFDGIW